ncbi:transcriptional regulator, TetR family [Spongiibacter sp. IMCC21906]|uniref:TetR/AcrR family transcriptional regulator n=1 Tax=Spongiibacter sp. IMCC21906 TaxID=1620392 RepID=UPI00062DD7DF|nr:TetR/AcrR family transcriptional regulator [Spongiibacter sp. IMCC21906]AKH67912.1 transcriptional regulator, TetR family [Spongiibacter sp. IMCC21906]
MSSTTKNSPRVRHSRQFREKQIIDAARGIFEKKGYEAATISEIADSVGVVEGTVLHYFHNKRTLIVRVIENFYAETQASMEGGLKAIHGSQDKLRYAILSHMTFLKNNAYLCSVILNESRGAQLKLSDKMHQFNRLYTSSVINIVKEGQAAGEISKTLPPDLLRNIVFGTTEHYLWDFLSNPEAAEENSLKVAELLTALLFNGIHPQESNKNAEIKHLINKLNTLIS